MRIIPLALYGSSEVPGVVIRSSLLSAYTVVVQFVMAVI